MTKQERLLLNSICYMAQDFATDDMCAAVIKLAEGSDINPETRGIVYEFFHRDNDDDK
jgi:hypothetical protein